MNKSHELGRYAENLAAKYLLSIGWRILARNIRNDYGELDIIADDSGELVIVEVRCRTENKFQSALDSVDKRKIRALMRSSSDYVDSIGWVGFWRIDVIAITVSRYNVYNTSDDFELEHIRDITGGMELSF